jgi:hypothetical protein
MLTVLFGPLRKDKMRLDTWEHSGMSQERFCWRSGWQRGRIAAPPPPPTSSKYRGDKDESVYCSRHGKLA